MKRGLIMLLLVGILFLQSISAETTFFEGDLGYRNNFIMVPVSEGGGIDLCGDNFCNSGEDCEICPQDCGACSTDSGSGGGSAINKELVCDIVFDSLKEHINQYREIDYDESELEILNIELKEELNVYLLDNQVMALVENFDGECDRPYPILSGSAVGRFRNLFSPLIIGITILVSAIILYFILRRFNKVKIGKRKRKRK
jgi:hypothetical protein